MTRTVRLLLVFIGVLLFAIGVLLGQQNQRSKFARYLQPESVTAMDMGLLRANIESLMDLASPGGFPRIRYQASCQCFWANGIVSDELMKQPLDQVRGELMVRAGLARANLVLQFPDMSSAAPNLPDHDFKMTFSRYNFDKPGHLETVAEYSDGKILFK